jgi:hypothetical protein
LIGFFHRTPESPLQAGKKKGLGIFTVSFIVTNVATSSATTDYNINFYFFVIQY